MDEQKMNWGMCSDDKLPQGKDALSLSLMTDKEKKNFIEMREGRAEKTCGMNV